jgi:hypothetical protein
MRGMLTKESINICSMSAQLIEEKFVVWTLQPMKISWYYFAAIVYKTVCHMII